MTTGTFSQDLVTDSYTIIHFAANKAKFDQWELFEYKQWQVFKVSLPSIAAYILFSVGQVDIFWTHMAGIIPAFIGILIILWAIRRYFDNSNWLPVIIAAIFLMTNFILITYTRMPFLETGVILYFGWIVFLLHKGKLPLTKILIISILISLACLTGRIFSISIALALVTAMFFGEDKTKIKKFALLIGGMVTSGIILLFILYGNRVTAYFQYIAEHTETSGGNLRLLQGVGEFIQVLFSYGSDNQLFRDSPFLFIAAYIAIVTAILLYRNHYGWFRSNFLLRFGLWWAGWLFVFFSPFNYRPLRYSLLLYLPLVLIMVSVIDVKDIKQARCPKLAALLSTILLYLLNFYFLVHIVIDFFFFPNYQDKQLTVYTYIFLPAIILTLIMVSRSAQTFVSVLIKKAGLIIAGLAICSLVYQSYAYFQWINHSHRTTETAVSDLAECIGPDAVIAGPYAPRLTLTSNIKSFIYSFGLDRPDFSIFERFPITHVAVDRTNLLAAQNDFSELQNTMIVTNHLIRARTILVVSIEDTVSEYTPSLFETAERFLQTDIIDSALVYNSEFRSLYPDNIPGIKQAYKISAYLRDFSNCLAILDDLRSRHPQNADAMLFCAVQYKLLGIARKREDLLTLSRQCLDKTKWLYMGDEENLQRSYDRIGGANII
jgi:hypothetical protein